MWAQPVGVWDMTLEVTECGEVFPGNTWHSHSLGKELFRQKVKGLYLGHCILRGITCFQTLRVCLRKEGVAKWMSQDWLKCGWGIMSTDERITHSQSIRHKHLLGLLELGNVNSLNEIQVCLDLGFPYYKIERDTQSWKNPSRFSEPDLRWPWPAGAWSRISVPRLRQKSGSDSESAES